MTLGTHTRHSLDYGVSRREEETIIKVDISKLNIKINIDSKTGINYCTVDNLKAYRNCHDFIYSEFLF